MTKPTADSLSLVQTFMDNEQEPLVGYLALMVGEVMRHNLQAVSGLLKERRAGFDAAGAGDLLKDLESGLIEIFEPFIHEECPAGK